MNFQPDIILAFSIIIVDFLYLQLALPFGTDFSPQNWEPVRRIIEVLAETLFKDNSAYIRINFNVSHPLANARTLSCMLNLAHNVRVS